MQRTLARATRLGTALAVVGLLVAGMACSKRTSEPVASPPEAPPDPEPAPEPAGEPSEAGAEESWDTPDDSGSQDTGAASANPQGSPERGGAPDGGMERPSQPAQPEQPAQAEMGGGNEYDDETVEAFAQAYMEVSQIQNDYQQQMANAEGQEAAQSLQKDANEEIMAAIEQQGLSVSEFQELGQAINQNPELRLRVEDALRGSQK